MTEASRRPRGREDKDVVAPIHRSSTYRLDDEAYDLLESHRGQDALVYTRWGNPTNDACAARIAELEGAEKGLMAASGMGAITSTVLGLLPEGGRLLATPVLYGGTRGLFDKDVARFGFDVAYADPADPDAFAEAVAADGGADLVYTEPITNPLVRVVDVPEVARAARDAGATCVVDSTFATPVLFRPLEHGADVVVHSATKYLGGHGDVVAGWVGTDADRWDRIWSTLINLGPCADPGAAFLVHRGVKTLRARVERHCDNAQAVAEFLAERSGVEAVHYPGLPDHPDHGLASKMFDVGFGGMLAFDTGDYDRARRALSRLEVFHEAASLGGVESLASMPVNTSHVHMEKAERERIGITEGLVRLSVGIEPAEALVEDLDRALG